MKTTLRHIAVAILGMLALLLPAPATAAEPAQPSGTDSTFIQVGPTQVEASLNIHTEQELNDFLLSSTPKDVWEDVETGNVTKVTLHKEEAAPYTDYQSYCDTLHPVPHDPRRRGCRRLQKLRHPSRALGRCRAMAHLGNQRRPNPIFPKRSIHHHRQKGPWTWSRLSGTVDVVQVRVWN